MLKGTYLKYICAYIYIYKVKQFWNNKVCNITKINILRILLTTYSLVRNFLCDLPFNIFLLLKVFLRLIVFNCKMNHQFNNNFLGQIRNILKLTFYHDNKYLCLLLYNLFSFVLQHLSLIIFYIQILKFIEPFCIFSLCIASKQYFFPLNTC